MITVLVFTQKSRLVTFFTAHVSIFAQRRRGCAENAKRNKGELSLFLRSDNAISPTHRTGCWKNRLITAFLPPAFQFSRRGAERNKGELSLFLRSDNAISSHTVLDAENRLVTSFLLPAFLFSRRGAEVAQRTQRGIKGSWHFLGGDDPIFRTHRAGYRKQTCHFLRTPKL